MLNFVVAVIERFNIGQNLTHVALVRFSNNAEVLFGLTAYLNRCVHFLFFNVYC